MQKCICEMQWRAESFSVLLNFFRGARNPLGTAKWHHNILQLHCLAASKYMTAQADYRRVQKFELEQAASVQLWIYSFHCAAVH